jgi:hypothetical protein
LLCAVRYGMSGDARLSARPPKRYRGSPRRLKRIRMRGNSSWELWLVVGWVFFLLFGLLPWMAEQMP